MKRYLVGVGLLLVGAISVAPAWWVKGHESITEGAASQLPDLDRLQFQIDRRRHRAERLWAD